MPDSHNDLFQCGTENDLQHVDSYDGTLGVPKNFVLAHMNRVGHLRWNSDLSTKYDKPGTFQEKGYAQAHLYLKTCF